MNENAKASTIGSRGSSSPKPHAYMYISMAQTRFLVHFCESNRLFLALRHSHTHPNDLLI